MFVCVCVCVRDSSLLEKRYISAKSHYAGEREIEEEGEREKEGGRKKEGGRERERDSVMQRRWVWMKSYLIDSEVAWEACGIALGFTKSDRQYKACLFHFAHSLSL